MQNYPGVPHAIKAKIDKRIPLEILEIQASAEADSAAKAKRL